MIAVGCAQHLGFKFFAEFANVWLWEFSTILPHRVRYLVMGSGRVGGGGSRVLGVVVLAGGDTLSKGIEPKHCNHRLV